MCCENFGDFFFFFFWITKELESLPFYRVSKCFKDLMSPVLWFCDQRLSVPKHLSCFEPELVRYKREAGDRRTCLSLSYQLVYLHWDRMSGIASDHLKLSCSLAILLHWNSREKVVPYMSAPECQSIWIGIQEDGTV